MNSALFCSFLYEFCFILYVFCFVSFGKNRVFWAEKRGERMGKTGGFCCKNYSDKTLRRNFVAAAPGSLRTRIVIRVVGQTQLGQRGPPFDVVIWNVEFRVELFQFGVKTLVALLLPLCRCGVAEKQPAAHRPALVGAAEFAGLKRAALAGPAGRRVGWSHGSMRRCPAPGGPDISQKCRILLDFVGFGGLMVPPLPGKAAAAN